MPKQFDVILTNPPFQDSVNRGKTPHKLWIDFTRAVFDRLLVDGGLLCQVSPSSFRSPSNRILALMKDHETAWIRFDTGAHFPDVGSTFSDYLIYKLPNSGQGTLVEEKGQEYQVLLDERCFYLPNDPAPEALPIHTKVVFTTPEKLNVEHDYVTCHNVLLRKSDTLSKTRTDRHVYPVFHTNRQTWWSSLRQGFAGTKKVMWTRSGYTKPFYDAGTLGGTDLVYFVRVETEDQGLALEHNLNLSLMRYVLQTARWSGFGNERVFESLPALPTDRRMSDQEMFEMFGLTPEEAAHVIRTVG